MTQIALKLPEELLHDVDRLVTAGRFSSRSHAVRAALEALIRLTERREIDDAFRDGFRRVPETDEEMADATRLAIESIEEEPWERWW